MMKTSVVAILGLVTLAAAVGGQQPPQRPMSPEGSAQVQVLGKWVKPERPTFALGREQYTGGKWIEITYGRPLQRQRDLFGSGTNYGKAINDVGTATLPPPPVWRAGANVSTRLKSEVNLAFGAKTVPPSEYTVFIDLVKPTEWTLIISRWGAQTRYDPNNKDALWGAYGYTPDKDVARVPMKVETLPFAVDELTWTFLDMTPDSGRVAIMWGKTMASAPFKASAPAAPSGQGATPASQGGGGGGPAPLLVPNPHYASVHMTVDVNAPVDRVWARVGKYCDIGEWGGFGGCTIVSGTDGEVGVVRSIGSEIMVAKTQYSYTYAQPVRTSGFYNMYHGTLEARALSPTTTQLHYTLFFDNSNLADDAARETDVTNRRTRFTGMLQNMKTLAEGGTLPARGRGALASSERSK